MLGTHRVTFALKADDGAGAILFFSLKLRGRGKEQSDEEVFKRFKNRTVPKSVKLD